MVKLFILFSYFIFSFLFNHPAYLLALFLNLILLSISAQKFRESMKSLRYFVVVVLILIVIYSLLNKEGDNVIVHYSNVPVLGTFRLTWNAFVMSLITSFQLLIVVYSFILFNLLIDTDQLMQTLIKLRLPFTLVLLITLSLRFFPLLQKDLEIITEVQKARGYELDEGGYFKKMRKRMVLLLPLLANSLERSIQVSEALETRGFTKSKGRTFYSTITFRFRDVLNIIIVVGFISGLIFGKIVGLGGFQVFPLLILPKIAFIDAIILPSICLVGTIQILLLRGGGKK
ncbi:MAG: energy-coupling factor transporter transmembrane protein EcfT [Promethearchaeota archaeon]|nr:MAG: energy-coupling factor transporter transmembrane protein EcfT [Candidatus Lokiarchaeota archaeon]